MTAILIPYLIAITLLTLTPGLDTTLIIRTATLEGKSKAFQAALGISLGCIAWGIVVACGLGALLMASDLAFNILKWMGAAYLAWLGLNMILKPRSQLADIQDNHSNRSTSENWFIKGFFGNLLNPKVGIFIFHFFPVHSSASIGCYLGDGASNDSCGDWRVMVKSINSGYAATFALSKATQVCKIYGPNYGQYFCSICFEIGVE